MKLLGGFWNFHVWNTKPLLFMLDFIRQSLGVGGRYMICLVWICLDLVYQLECLLYIYVTWEYYVLWFSFFSFFLFWCTFESLSNPRFDQDLNKYKTWKWKGEACILLSHSKMKFLGCSWNFHVWNPKPLLFMLDFIRYSLGARG